jgi:protease-4
MRLIGRIFLWLFALVGFVTVASAVLGIVAAIFYAEKAPELPDRMVLRLDLNKGIPDARADEPWDALLNRQVLTLRDTVAALDRAARDDRVAGIEIHLGSAAIGIATAQELHQAIADFRGQDKFAMGFATSLSGSGNMMPAYMLAASFDSMWMQPSGTLGLTGIALEIPFIREALDKVGVDPEFEQRHEYKSAVETFTRSGLSLPARQSLEQVVQGWMDQVLGSIAADRNLPLAQLRALVDRSPLLSEEARENGLVDTLGYADAFQAAVRERAGADAHLIDLAEYAANAGPVPEDAVRVALIYGTGPIVDDGGGDGLLSDEKFSAAATAGAITMAADDGDIRAIVLRIDSPGGSYIASDTVRRAVLLAREKGKVVIASMGAMAASGGYFAAMGADRIVAQPGTLTGSIGVFGGKFATEALWKKFGINWEQVSVGANAGMWNGIRPFSPSAAARHGAILDAIYRDFTEKVAEDRKIAADSIDAVARGRVWTGADAREVGLVDELGGLTTAFGLVRTSLGLDDATHLDVVLLPRKESPLDRLKEFLGKGTPLPRIVADIARKTGFGPYGAVMEQVEPVVRDLEMLRPSVGVLQLPPYRVVQ